MLVHVCKLFFSIVNSHSVKMFKKKLFFIFSKFHINIFKLMEDLSLFILNMIMPFSLAEIQFCYCFCQDFCWRSLIKFSFLQRYISKCKKRPSRWDGMLFGWKKNSQKLAKISHTACLPYWHEEKIKRVVVFHLAEWKFFRFIFWH